MHDGLLNILYIHLLKRSALYDAYLGMQLPWSSMLANELPMSLKRCPNSTPNQVQLHKNVSDRLWHCIYLAVYIACR